ncbi:MAG TPA: DUF2516 family protein [Acidimicrobiales bacterium]|nr:DUF2516 family protein [Acidimicrobiales bacterium]
MEISFFMVIMVIVGIIGLIGLGLVIWGVIDAATRPNHAWTAAGQNKVLWIALQVGGLIFTTIGGPVIAVIYLVAIRPKVAEAQKRRA